MLKNNKIRANYEISRHRQEMKYRNTVYFFSKYRSTRQKRTNPVTPEKYKPLPFRGRKCQGFNQLGKNFDREKFRHLETFSSLFPNQKRLRQKILIGIFLSVKIKKSGENFGLGLKNWGKALTGDEMSGIFFLTGKNFVTFLAPTFLSSIRQSKQKREFCTAKNNTIILLIGRYYIEILYRINNVGQNYSSEKIFVTSGKFRHFCPMNNFVIF